VLINYSNQNARITYNKNKKEIKIAISRIFQITYIEFDRKAMLAIPQVVNGKEMLPGTF